MALQLEGHTWREFSPGPAFFRPLHAAQLETDFPKVLPYLALPPGSRFFLRLRRLRD